MTADVCTPVEAEEGARVTAVRRGGASQAVAATRAVLPSAGRSPADTLPAADRLRR
jgi:hypothetical protein